MRLTDLAEVFLGYAWSNTLLVQGGPNDIAYLESFSRDYRYISFKDGRKKNINKSNFLQYGDYLLYREDRIIKLFRYEEIGSRRTLASDKFIIIRSEFAILNEFLAHVKNKEYFYAEIRQKACIDDKLDVSEIKNIEIFTDNIRELNEVITAEDIGINTPVDISQINILQKPLPMDKLVKRINNEELLLDTDFQRRPDLWDLTIKSRFIESMLVRLPVPAFYFDGSNDDKWQVIDGLQRLSAVQAYLEGKFGLQDLVFLPDHFLGKTFDQLERPYQRNIEEYEIFAYIIQRAPASIKYKLFRNINTGSLRLEPQEIRHTVNPGKPAQFLKTIVSTEWFKRYVPMSDRHRDRMNDREAVLRFVTFRQLNIHEYQSEGGIVEILDKSMTNLYDTPEAKLNAYADELKLALERIYMIFGEDPFSRTLFDPDQKAVAHNSILFELLTNGFARITEYNYEKIINRKEEVVSAIKDYLLQKSRNIPRFWDSSFAYSIEGIKRFDEFNKFLNSIVL